MLSEGRSQEIADLLIQHGADLGNRNTEGKTPLHTFFNPVIASTVMRHPEALTAETLACDNDGMMVHHYIAWSSKSGPEHLSHYNLTRQRCLFARADHEGRTALHFACQRGNIAILKYLFLQLEIDTEIRRRDNWGRTAFHYAVQSKRVEAIDLLFSHDADIHAVDSKGRTVLHHAAMRNNLAAVKRVLELGGHCDLFSVDLCGLAPAALARNFRSHAVMEHLDALNVNNGILPPNRQKHDVVKNCRNLPSRQQPIGFSLHLERHWLNRLTLVFLAISCWVFLRLINHLMIGPLSCSTSRIIIQ